MTQANRTTWQSPECVKNQGIYCPYAGLECRDRCIIQILGEAEPVEKVE